MMGGSWFEELFGDPDKCDPNYLSEVAVKSIRDQLNITKEPYRVVCRIQKVQYILRVYTTCRILSHEMISQNGSVKSNGNM